MRDILIISNSEDGGTSGILPYLNKDRYLFLNVDHIQKYKISISNKTTYLEDQNGKYNIKDFKTVLIRRLNPSKKSSLKEIYPNFERVNNILKVDPKIEINALEIAETVFQILQNKKYQNLNTNYFLLSLLNELKPNTRIISPLDKMKKADIKPIQLKEANSSGIRTPKTIFTNSLEEILSCFKKFGSKRLVIKYHSMFANSIFFSGENNYYVNFTARSITEEEFLKEHKNNLKNTLTIPMMVQEDLNQINGIKEARITVIGDKIMGFLQEVIGEKQKNLPSIKEYNNTVYSPLPKWFLKENIDRSYLNYAKKLGLLFYTADIFIHPDKKEHYLIETNTAGQYTMLTEEIKEVYPAAKTMAEFLMKKN